MLFCLCILIGYFIIDVICKYIQIYDLICNAFVSEWLQYFN